MIENKELGMKVAENKEEAFWTKTKEDVEKRLEDIKHALIIEKDLLRLCRRKLKKCI